MGAGRSGTTLLATLLGNSEHIVTLGEMHQFLDYLLENKPCSCGQQLPDCEFWKPVLEKIKAAYTTTQLAAFNKANKRLESHSQIIGSLLFRDKKYQAFQKDLFTYIGQVHNSPLYLDSAKYISRGVQLAKTPGIDIKIVYVVRDVRGIIHSFKKKVQTSKSPLSAIVYYSTINSFGLLAQWVLGRKKVMRLRYESLMSQPENSLRELSKFIGEDLSKVTQKLQDNEPFTMPHIVGGNRLKANKRIKLSPDFAWKKSQSRPTQILYYLLTLPILFIFKYRI